MQKNSLAVLPRRDRLTAKTNTKTRIPRRPASGGKWGIVGNPQESWGKSSISNQKTALV